MQLEYVSTWLLMEPHMSNKSLAKLVIEHHRINILTQTKMSAHINRRHTKGPQFYMWLAADGNIIVGHLGV